MLNYTIIDNWGEVFSENIHSWSACLSKIQDLQEKHSDEVIQVSHVIIEDEDGEKYYIYNFEDISKVEELKNLLNNSQYIDDIEQEQILRELEELKEKI